MPLGMDAATLLRLRWDPAEGGQHTSCQTEHVTSLTAICDRYSNLELSAVPVRAEATSKHWHGAFTDQDGAVGGGALLGLDIKIVQPASSKWALASRASVCEYLKSLRVSSRCTESENRLNSTQACIAIEAQSFTVVPA